MAAKDPADKGQHNGQPLAVIFAGPRPEDAL